MVRRLPLSQPHLLSPPDSAQEDNLPHKYVTTDVIERQKQDIANCDTSIARLRAIGSGGPSALDLLKEMVRDLRETAKEKKDNALDATMGDGRLDAARLDRAALICRGQEIAFDNVLSVMEDPQAGIDHYMTQKKNLEEELARLESYDQRPSR